MACPPDLADTWLAHSLLQLSAACEEADNARRTDASRLAVVLAALAVETRLNRVLHEHDPGWDHDNLASPLEKFQLLPRLVAQDVVRHNELSGLLVEVLDRRSELTDSGAPVVTPRDAARVVIAAAEICTFLDPTRPEADRVRSAALAAHAETSPPAEPGEFPPELVGS